ncbi:hypothetical protein BGX21_000785 [Mortierella sp. AD011]|nr:hypothetical protein BGX20_000815 [Mortierella sp. AD010]KAF9386489.1 hypothetical protein BGX21_000785 [Mortierella sp. AD011]
MSSQKDAADPAPWTKNEIAYCAVGGILACMALAEIVSVAGSLTYSFIKVHSKAKAAGQRGVQYLSLIMLVIFWVAKVFFLGSMFSLIPVPHWQGMQGDHAQDHQFIPAIAITISQYISFSLVALLLVMPTLVSLNQLLTSPRDVKEKLEAVRTTSTFPRVLIVMPVYNELPEVLHVAICSAIDGDYPKEHLHIFISFDNDAISDLYRALIRNLGIPADGDYYPPVLDLYFRGVQITVSRFPHGGKRLTQKKTFGLINSIYKEYPDKTDHLFVLFIDSDIVLPASTIANFVWDMELKPNSKNLLAMTGVITVTTKEDITFLNLLQDIEYVHGQFIGRAIESAVGGCVTLPGALTIFRYSAFLESYDEYFAERSVSDLWDFGRSHLGEDRYLTHLLMTKAARPKLIQFCHRATCKTEPVREWRNLMKQRRRWFLGFLTNEGAFLSDPHLWRKYPWLLSFRLVQDIVTGTSMVSYITIVAIALGMQHWSPIWLGLLVSYFFLNWGLMFTYGVWLGRYKALFYPLMFFVGPFVSWFLLVTGVMTANERTWGGPRADAAKKDGDEEHGAVNDDHGNSGHPEDGFDPDEEKQIELPDHLFYPNQQELVRRKSGRRRPANPSSKDDSDVHSLDLSTEAIDDVAKEELQTAAPTPEPGVMSSSGFGGDKAEESWDDDDYYSDEERNADLGREHSVYLGAGPLGFTPHPLLKSDTEWWDDTNHLSNLGILPFVEQPKIPAMFASAETLILTPILPSPSLDFDERRLSKSTARSSRGSASPLLSARDATPGTPKMKSAPSTPKFIPSSGPSVSRPTTPATPRKGASRRGSVSNSLSMPSPALQGMRFSASTQSSLPLPPGVSPSPRPSFRYVPVEYLTPTTTPKMSPMILPSPSGLASTPTSLPPTPPLPSPPLSYSSATGPTIHASAKVPPAIIAAAMAISNGSQASNPLIKRMSSRGKVVLAEGTSTSVPPVPYPLPPAIPQRIASKSYFPPPPIGPSSFSSTTLPGQ